MSDGGFLSRWARLKEAAKRTPEPAPPDDAPAPAEPAPEATAEDPDALRVLLESLPKLDELTKDTDVRLFFQKGVPDVLRNAALKRIWALDPEVNRFSEMAEYAWDWNTPGGAPSFGPLEEGFDVSGMLERILPNRPDYDFDPARAVADQSKNCDMPSQIAVEETPGEPTADAAPQQATVTDPAASADEVPDIGTAAEAVTTDGTAPTVALRTAAPAAAPAEPIRPRRHGGALPG